MRSHAKAPSAGSSTRQGKCLGAILRGVFAAALIALALPAAASAAPPTLTIDPVDPATEVGYVTVHLSGTVEVPADGLGTYWCLETAEEGTLAWSGFCYQGPVQPGETAAVETDISGLKAGTAYEARLSALNSTDFVEEHSSTVAFTTEPVAKPTITDPLITDITDDSAHFSAEVDPNGTDPAFDASWHFECTPSCGGLSGGTVSGSQQTVESDAIALKPNTTYTVRIVASNAGGTEKRTETFSTPGAEPRVVPFGAGPVQPTSADINGEVSPRGADTVYWFEWGTEDCSISDCASIPAERDASVGSDQRNHYVSRHLTGLTPGTTYHSRLVAKSANGTVEGLDREFTTPTPEPPCPNVGALGTDHLPDCRAYELVSPVDKNGGGVVPHSQRTRASSDGDAVNFTSLSSFANPQGAAEGSEYISQRTAIPGTPGWSTHGITPLQDPVPVLGTFQGRDPLYQGPMSDDLSRGVYRAYRPLGESPNVAGLLNLYVRDDLRTGGPGSYRLITDPGIALTSTFVPEEPHFRGASEDFSTVIFDSELNLTPDAGPFLQYATTKKLYENRDGNLRLAGRVPPEGETECDDSGAVSCHPASSSKAGPDLAWQMVSSDGEHVFFQASSGSEENVYMRVGGTSTVQLNVSEKDVPEDSRPATLWTASVDGTRIFFSTAEGLVDGDENSSDDYYMYDTGAPDGSHLTLVSEDNEPADQPIGMEGVVGASKDGHYLYFMSSDDLVAGDVPLHPSLYVWHDGDVRSIGSFTDGIETTFNNSDSPYTYMRQFSWARVSSDGRHLLFAGSELSGFQGRGGFEGFDATGADGSEPVCNPRCRELFVYDADSGRLACVSCDPTGASPMGDAQVNIRPAELVGNLPYTPYLNHPLSGNGRWAFFNSPDALAPEDINGQIDAYEYDTVTKTTHLLSSGTSPDHSYVLDASADGRDVFIVTSESLSEWDPDTLYDMYDVRVAGGLPEPAPAPAPCGGENCRPPAEAGPAQPPVGSAQPGPGNPLPPRCRKGQRAKPVGGKVRCIRKGHRHRSPHRRSDRRVQGGRK